MYGGGIYNNDGTVTIDHSLIARNKATVGGGGIYDDDDGAVTLAATDITRNSPDNCEPTGAVTGC